MYDVRLLIMLHIFVSTGKRNLEMLKMTYSKVMIEAKVTPIEGVEVNLCLRNSWKNFTTARSQYSGKIIKYQICNGLTNPTKVICFQGNVEHQLFQLYSVSHCYSESALIIKKQLILICGKNYRQKINQSLLIHD